MSEQDQKDDQQQDTGRDDTDDTSSEESEDDDGTEDLGDKGKQALDRMKEQRNALRNEVKEWKALSLSPAEIRKVLDERKNGDDKPDPDAIREEARREARTEALRERVTDRIEARAAKSFADAEDAVAILMRAHDPDDFLDGDKIDAEAIQEALDDLLERKPHLAAQGGRRFQGSADGGTRKESGPKQLTRDDLKRLSPQQIEDARRKGQLDELLSGKK